MPYINIRITREGATAEQKAALISGATQLLQDVLGKNPATTVVVIAVQKSWHSGEERSPCTCGTPKEPPLMTQRTRS